jgi:hypothetical protein
MIDKTMDYEKLYLDYFNNFLTVERFAEYYELDVITAQNVINEGRKINHARRY